ncbi:beta-mannosidase [Nakamurella panacisegetis]|uniref:beta-mannosidase n=1 Tax=Nakamurella panacisegetis TaxID=1090615 RepID=A0A1H0QIN2_9ACTN|nr:glycoside hydrolase family 2 protein [Nakamurella panacisegetis]SDP16576.1 beta-mannosidase [Nakamurella panacisegetis]
MTLLTRPLSDGWSVSLDPPGSAPALPALIPATVPGCVHTDLLAAGLIPDPYLDENEVALDWIGRQQWRYRTTFDWAPDGHEHHDLVFDGLDTIATVFLNGVEIASTANQHRTYRVPVAGRLLAGSNELEVLFGSAWAYAEDWRDRLGDLPGPYAAPYNFIRKMACNFGWDWGPGLVTAGIWKPVALESWSTARLSAVRPVITVDGGDGRIDVVVDLEPDTVDMVEMRVTAAIAGISASMVVPRGATSVSIPLTVPEVELWWPHDLGPQPLYDLHVELSAGGSPLDERTQRIGFRTITVDTSPDEIGSAFTIVVNGIPIFVRGANWIPDDCFPSRVTAERLAARIDQAIAANVNLLRVWGGGIFESDDFYRLCDEHGVLVWQDFLFACAAYPEEEPFRSEVIQEARDNVTRLMPHASLALFNGANENIWGYQDWGWQSRIGDRTWGAGYYTDLLPAVVAELDPARFYYPGSPYSGSLDQPANLDSHGLRHIWDVWNEVDYTTYASYVPRFAAEFGYQAPPTYTTLRRAISDRPLRPDSPGMRHHQKADDGNLKLARGAAAHLPTTADFDDWLYLMYVQQAEAVRFGVEHLRSHRGVCMGSVVWQLNDCWPVTSWAAIDGDGRPKLLWYALRDAYADRLLTVQPQDGGLELFGVNDSRQPWAETVTVERITFDGTVVASHTVELSVPGLSLRSVQIPPDVAAPRDPRAEVLLVRGHSGAVALHFFTADKDLALPDPELRVEVMIDGDAARIVVHATGLARHVGLQADRLHPAALSDDALVTIRPGSSHTFTVRGAGAFTADDVWSTKALQHLAGVARA